MKTLSVITINYNNLAGLRSTIASVLKQSFEKIEYIIIDGGSDDGSKELIAHHSSALAYWTSEKDNGVYHAMNKGIAKASGEYILFLNSGDYFINEQILDKMIPHLTEKDIIYGNLLIKESDREWVKSYPECPNFKYFVHDTLPHSGGCFIKKELFSIAGMYDESLYITADWKFYMNAIFKHDATTKYLNELISVFVFDGISSKPENRVLIEAEKNKFIVSHFGHLYELYCELEIFKQKYQLLANSKFVKAYSSIKKLFVR